MAVLYMVVNEGLVQTKLAFYNFGSVGENEIDHLVSAKDYDGKIIPRVEFLNAATAYVLGSDFFDVYYGTQKPISIKEEELKDEIRSIFHNEKYFGFVLKNSTGNKPYKIELYDLKGNKKADFEMDMEYQDVQIESGSIYLSNETECMVFNLKGKLKYKGRLDENIVSIVPLGRKKIMAILETKTQILTFK